jgi:8-oxo-dGTP pyrophosphatase MutT (NUDIX family)
MQMSTKETSEAPKYWHGEIGMKALIPLPDSEEWRYLFLERRKVFESEKQPRMDIPGGRMEDEDFKLNEDGSKRYDAPTEALAREVLQETGLTILRGGNDEPMPFGIPQKIIRPQPLPEIIRMTNLALVEPGVVRISNEHSAWGYLTRHEALWGYLDANLRKLLENKKLFQFESYVQPAEICTLGIRMAVAMGTVRRNEDYLP